MEELGEKVSRFQRVNMAFKYAAVPVVARRFP